MRAALVLAGLLAAAPAAAKDHYPHIQRDPTPVAPDHDPCHLFETEDEFVSFYLDAGEEKVPLKAPKVYFEDRWDFEQGATHGAQLFRVGIVDFLPVTRRETTRRMKAGERNWITILLTQFVPLHEMAQIRARLYRGLPDKSLHEFDRISADFGLERLEFEIKKSGEEIYLGVQDGHLSSVLTCDPDGQVPFPNCKLFFKDGLLSVTVLFYKTELPNWQQIRNRVERFITCMREASRQ